MYSLEFIRSAELLHIFKLHRVFDVVFAVPYVGHFDLAAILFSVASYLYSDYTHLSFTMSSVSCFYHKVINFFLFTGLFLIKDNVLNHRYHIPNQEPVI